MELIKLLRPKHWIKNFFVLGALIFSSSFLDANKVISALAAFFLFCLVSSCVYIMNDIVDLERDKLHPKKRLRPLASGKVSLKSAKTLLAAMMVVVFTTSFLVDTYIALLLALYFFNNILYSFKIKHIVLLDVLSISFGFILRIITGGVAIDVQLSPWIVLCTLFISLLLGFEKRRAEIVSLEKDSSSHRAILEEYSLELLDQLATISVSCTLVFYALYTIMVYPEKPMFITTIFVVYGVFRYKLLIQHNGQGGSPTDTIIADRSIVITVALWTASCMLIILNF